MQIYSKVLYIFVWFGFVNAMAMNTAKILEVPPPPLALNEESLLDYLRRTFPVEWSRISKFVVKQLTYGQSNPTYALMGESQYGTQCVVLRKKPPGKLLASAHSIEREFHILSSLRFTHIPVPQPLALCEDTSIVGTSFYLMNHVQGVVYNDANLPMLPPVERQEVYSSMAATLAQLHAIKPASVGLTGFGRGQNYCRRQVNRWWGQFCSSVEGTPNTSVSSLRDWLLSHIPDCDASMEGSIAHGDYKIDNLIFNEERPRAVKAIVDWELSTLGNPWADVAFCCMPYFLPQIPYILALKTPLSEGIPTEAEFLKRYCHARGIEPPSPLDWSFYKCLALFRIASIAQGVGSRAKQGNAASKSATNIGSDQVVHSLVARGLELAKESMRRGEGMVQGSNSGFGPTPRVKVLAEKLHHFMTEKIFPAEAAWEEHAQSKQRWSLPPFLEELKSEAKAQGLWNLWLPADTAESIQDLVRDVRIKADADILLGPGLSNLEYAHLSEIMGACLWASEVFNCSSPDTGNMEILARFGTRAQKLQYLLPLLEGKIRSCFGMTEKAVASSDARNIQSEIVHSGGDYVINGRKWWTTGALHPLCKFCIFMGKTDPRAPSFKQQSMVLVPMDSPGISIPRPLIVFGDDDAPVGHAEVLFENVRVPRSTVLLGEGRGFEISQARLGPGRLHHCMRLVGLAERAMSIMKQRAHSRQTFGTMLSDNAFVQIKLAECRIDIEAARLLVLHAADQLDKVGNKKARVAISVAKIHVPRSVCGVIDYAIQLHGGGGVSDDTPLARMWVSARSLRIADGPDDVHLSTVGRIEMHSLHRSKM